MKRWNIVENDMRVFCKDVKESNEDLILRCKNVNQIWDTVKFFLKFWCIVENNWNRLSFWKEWENLFLSSLISLNARIIYKYKMKCKIENKDEKPQEICDHIKKMLSTYIIKILYTYVNNNVVSVFVIAWK